MSMSMNIHPQSRNVAGCLRLKAYHFTPENSNAVRVLFTSDTRSGGDDVEMAITAFNLSDQTAEGLHLFASIDETYRAKLLPILRDMLAEQELEKEDA